MLIRWKRWKQSNTGIKIADPRQDCYFSKENDGIVDVRFKQVIDRLLAHQNEFEVAWEQYGISFDETGKEMIQDIPQVVHEPEPVVEEEPVDSVTEPVKKKRGRPAKVR